MKDGRPLRSTRRLQNLTASLPRWYNIAAPAGDGPTLVSIYDEIGFFGVSAGQFMADLEGITGPIEMHINSPGGDIYDGITIYNRLKQRTGDIHVIVDGLAASAASFIAMAASPGQLEMAPRSEMMIHNGFTMAIGDAADLRKTADLLDKKTADIAGMYADRSGKPADYWLGKMSEETWLSAEQTVAEGLADRIQGQPASGSNTWDMSVYGKFAAKGKGKKGKAFPGAAPPFKKGGGKETDTDPDGDGDDDTTAAGDTDHDYVEPDGSPGPKAKPGKGKKAKKAKAKAGKAKAGDLFPILAASVDSSPWDGSKAWANGAASDDPAAFYKGICAGRRAGDPSTQGAWALPYKYHPGDPVNAAGVKAALSALPKTEGLTNASDAKATLEKAMKAVNPDYDPDALVSPGIVASAFLLPRATVDSSPWDPAAAMAQAAASHDPAGYYAGICAGRKAGDPATPDAWALPFRYAPDGPVNVAGVRGALAELSRTGTLANAAEARTVLDSAMRAIDPAFEPDDVIDPELLSAAFAFGLKGADR